MARALKRARALLDDAHQVRARAQRQVVRRQWTRAADAALHNPEPFVRERIFGRGGTVELEEGDPPSPFTKGEAYGRDEAGRIVWARAAEGSEEVIAFEDDGVGSVAFDTAGTPRAASFGPVEDGLLRCWATIAHGRDGPGEWEIYRYDGDRVVAVHKRLVLVEAEPPIDDDSVDRLEYDASGRLARVIEESDVGGTRVTYERRGPSRRELQRALEGRLTDVIAERVRRHGGGREVYALLLHYQRQSALPPTPVLASAAYRERVLAATQDGGLLYLLFNPAELEDYDGTALGGGELGDDDAELTGLVDALARTDEHGVLARTVLQRVCKRLNAVDWSESLRPTEDFVVVCVDLELENFEEDLAAAVPSRALRTRLRKAGLLAR